MPRLAALTGSPCRTNSVPQALRGCSREACKSARTRCVQDHFGRTPLHVAATCGSLRSVDCIVANSAESVNVLDMHMSSPLDNARAQRHQAVEALLLDCGAVSGLHPSLSEERRKVQEWQKGERARVRDTARRKALEGLPETRHCHEMMAVESVVLAFVQVRAARGRPERSAAAMHARLIWQSGSTRSAAPPRPRMPVPCASTTEMMAVRRDACRPRSGITRYSCPRCARW